MKRLLLIILILFVVPFVLGRYQTSLSDTRTDCVNLCLSKYFEAKCRSIVNEDEYTKCKYDTLENCNKRCSKDDFKETTTTLTDDWSLNCENACKNRILISATEITYDACLKDCYESRNTKYGPMGITENKVYIYWQCHDGVEGKQYVECGSEDKWNKYAQEDCTNKCRLDRERNDKTGKCGVNKFIVFGYEKCTVGYDPPLPSGVPPIIKTPVSVSPEIGEECSSFCKEKYLTDLAGYGLCLKACDDYKQSGAEKELEVKEKEAMIRCSEGCMLDGKCAPIGYRAKGEYCDINGMTLQKSTGGLCENNFECKANFCEGTEEGGKCVEPGFFTKFAGWFKIVFRNLGFS